ncbi:SUKH-3 domain-containing protein [Streptomyces hyaluromycini]|uniref:SUKH-3 domain-containing protein n=1 Tax=Streptomyces hyaluromycini TaxID=1377993 RepID=UPI000B5C436A|nr:SUKH-3 domain-containing protein [Streptomyces hyaluromycini]
MDLQSTVTAFPRATPIDGLDRAWTWRLNPVLNFAGAPTGDGTRLLQMNQVRRRDDALARAVLAFARAHEPELTAEGRFLTFVGGFEAPGYSFDAVAATVPGVHGHHRVRNSDLTPLTTIVFPAYRCEFSGRETLETILLETGEHEMHAAARRFLVEFGQVGIACRAPADTMPWTDFRLDPLLAMWDAEILDDLGEQAGADLYPVGMVDRRNRYLAIAADGAVYTGMDSVSLWATTPDEALEKLARPVRPEALY